MLTYTLHITVARDFLHELSSKGLWLYVAKFVDGGYTVVHQGLTTPNVALSWEEGSSTIAVASGNGDGEAATSFLVPIPTDTADPTDPTSDERARGPISPLSSSTRDNAPESAAHAVGSHTSPVRFKVWFDYKGASAAMISHALERAIEVDFIALKKTDHEISFVLDPTPVNGFWSHGT